MKKIKLFIIEFMILNLFLVSCTKQKEINEIDNVTLDSPYIYMGLWPQSIKRDDVVIDSTLKNYNGWDCYKGSDNNYYVKETAINKSDEELKFSDGSIIEDGKEYYFLIEDIKWEVLTSSDNSKFLLSDSILTPVFFNENIPQKLNGKTIHPNNYGHSELRYFLNGLDGSNFGRGNYKGKGFIDKAFNDEEKKDITAHLVDNSQDSSNAQNNDKKINNPFICKDTKDKVFLLSMNQITEQEFGYSEYESNKTKSNKKRMRKLTDYSKALGLPFSNFYGTSSYYLRTPHNSSSNSVEIVSKMGSLGYSSLVSNVQGLVPAIYITKNKIAEEEIDESIQDYVIEQQITYDPFISLDTDINKEFSLTTSDNIRLGLCDDITKIQDFNESDYIITSEWGDYKWLEQFTNGINVRWTTSRYIINLATSSSNYSTFRGVKVGDSVSKLNDIYEKDSSLYLFNKEKNMFEKQHNNENAIFDMFVEDNEITVTSYNEKAEENMNIRFSMINDVISNIEIFIH